MASHGYADYGSSRLPLQIVSDAPVYVHEPKIEKLSYRARIGTLLGLTVSLWFVIGATVYAIGSAIDLL